MTTKPLKISEIRIDGGTQSRVQLDESHVAELRLAVPGTLPPVSVYWDGTDYWLVDGFHRVSAAREMGDPTIQATIKNGTRREAIRASLTANIGHGLKRSNADKRKAIDTLLADQEWSRMSDRAIAGELFVDNETVAARRSVLQTGGSASPTRVGKDGSTRPATKATKAAPPPPVDDDEDEQPEPEPEPAHDLPVDADGGAIEDEAIAEQFADGGFGEVAASITASLRLVAVLCSRPAGARIQRQTVETDLKNAARAVKAAMPHVLCPVKHVKGQRCGLCRNTGWLTKLEQATVPEFMAQEKRREAK